MFLNEKILERTSNVCFLHIASSDRSIKPNSPDIASQVRYLLSADSVVKESMTTKSIFNFF